MGLNLLIVFWKQNPTDISIPSVVYGYSQSLNVMVNIYLFVFNGVLFYVQRVIHELFNTLETHFCSYSFCIQNVIKIAKPYYACSLWTPEIQPNAMTILLHPTAIHLHSWLFWCYSIFAFQDRSAAHWPLNFRIFDSFEHTACNNVVVMRVTFGADAIALSSSYVMTQWPKLFSIYKWL